MIYADENGSYDEDDIKAIMSELKKEIARLRGRLERLGDREMIAITPVMASMEEILQIEFEARALYAHDSLEVK